MNIVFRSQQIWLMTILWEYAIRLSEGVASNLCTPPVQTRRICDVLTHTVCIYVASHGIMKTWANLSAVSIQPPQITCHATQHMRSTYTFSRVRCVRTNIRVCSSGETTAMPCDDADYGVVDDAVARCRRYAANMFWMFSARHTWILSEFSTKDRRNVFIHLRVDLGEGFFWRSRYMLRELIRRSTRIRLCFNGWLVGWNYVNGRIGDKLREYVCELWIYWRVWHATNDEALKIWWFEYEDKWDIKLCVINA